jgi:hypothetical protein
VDPEKQKKIRQNKWIHKELSWITTPVKITIYIHLQKRQYWWWC